MKRGLQIILVSYLAMLVLMELTDGRYWDLHLTFAGLFWASGYAACVFSHHWRLNWTTPLGGWLQFLCLSLGFVFGIFGAIPIILFHWARSCRVKPQGIKV